MIVSLITLSAPGLEAADLKSQLDAKRQAFLEKAPPEKIADYQAGIDQVAASGIYEEAIKIGDQAPNFTLQNHEGENVALEELLEEGPVVVTWYRGVWCPYCNLALAAMHEAYPEIEKAGGTLVAISPETPDYGSEVVEEIKPKFQVLSDAGQETAEEYGILFSMTPTVAEAMAKYDLAERNQDEGQELPLAATYVIGQDGIVDYAFLDADYRNRAEPDRIVEAVKASATGEPTGAHLVQTFWENVWNPPYQIDLIDELMTEDFVLTTAGNDIKGRENFKEWVEIFQGQASDLRLTNLDLITSEDGTKVVSRWKAEARNSGLFGTEPDGQPVSFTGIAIWKIEDGKLAHNWVERSGLELYRQLTSSEAAENFEPETKEPTAP